MDSPYYPETYSGEKVPLKFLVSAFKTILGTDDSILWEEGDAISIFDGVENCKFVTSGNGSSVVFEGEARNCGSWTAVYPYYQSTRFEDGKIGIDFKTAQISPSGSFGRGRSIAVCEVGKDRILSFKNAFSLLEFKLSTSNITSVTFSGNSNESIAGNAEISIKNGIPEVSFPSGRDYVNILPDKGETFSPGKYYAAIAPADFTAGINMRFTRSSDDLYSDISSNVPVSSKRNGILQLGTVDSALNWSKTDIQRIELEFRNESKSFWPFSSPSSISNNAAFPSYPGAPTTFTLDQSHGGYEFEVFAENGVFQVGSNNQGLKIMGGEGDYILLPSVDRKRLSAVEIRSGIGGFNRYPCIKTSDGMEEVSGGGVIESGFNQAGDSYRWKLYDTEFNTSYRLCFNGEGRASDGSNAARIQKLTLIYSAIPGGNPCEEQEVFGMSDDDVPDFSRVGYHFGDDDIPVYPVSITLEAPSGSISTAQDASGLIQDALDSAPAKTAVLLKSGTYYIDNPINLKRSGIVLRGEGLSTILKARVLTPSGDSTYIVKSSANTKLSDTRILRLGLLKNTSNERICDYSGAQRILKDAYCSQMYVCVPRPAEFIPGERVYIYRPGTRKWIHDLHMDEIYENGGETIQWTPSEYNLGWERTVSAVDGTRVYLDNPLVMSLTEEYGGGYIMKCSFERIVESGVENLVFDTDYNPSITDDSSKYNGKWGTYQADESHCWKAIMIFGAEHCWVSGVTARHMAGSCVEFRSGSRNITVQNCVSENPISVIQGSRRYAFHFNKAELCLVKDCMVSNDRHAFVTGVNCGGPNVFLRCSARNMYEDVGPHQRWATGCLYDNVSTDYWFTVQDRADAGSGHGWAGANFVLWNCDVVSRIDGLVPTAGRRIVVQSPWVSAKCWAFGCTGEKYNTTRTYKEHPSLGPRPDGVWTSFGSHMSTESLYEKQLSDRHSAGIRIYDGGNSIEPYLRDNNYYKFY